MDHPPQSTGLCNEGTIDRAAGPSSFSVLSFFPVNAGSALPFLSQRSFDFTNLSMIRITSKPHIDPASIESNYLARANIEALNVSFIVVMTIAVSKMG